MRFRRVPPQGPRGPSRPERTAPTPGEVVRSPEDAQRDDDRALLGALVARLAKESEEVAASFAGDAGDVLVPARDEDEFGAGDLGRLDEELSAFADMLAKLSAPTARTLSPKQRAWAVGVAERLDLSWGDPGARNRAVPRGAPVALLVDAMSRPLAPPGRKPTEFSP